MSLRIINLSARVCNRHPPPVCGRMPVVCELPIGKVPHIAPSRRKIPSFLMPCSLLDLVQRDEYRRRENRTCPWVSWGLGGAPIVSWQPNRSIVWFSQLGLICYRKSCKGWYQSMDIEDSAQNIHCGVFFFFSGGWKGDLCRGKFHNSTASYLVHWIC